MLFTKYLLSKSSRLLKTHLKQKITELVSQKPSFMNYQDKTINFLLNKSFESSYCVRSIHKSSMSVGNFPLTCRFLSKGTEKENVPDIQATFVLKEAKFTVLKPGKKKSQIQGTPKSQLS